MLKKIKNNQLQADDTVVGDATGIKWVMAIYLCSGICSLIDEVVWVRLLKLTLGNTEYASSIVVSVFMGGLALGALVMGRYADRVKRRLRLYSILEMIASVSALSLPLVLHLADSVYRWFFIKFQATPATLIFIQIIVSAAILLVPTMIMGSTLPLLSRYITSLQNKVGRSVGMLYALNTLGATLGCFLAGFVLIRLVGVMGTLYIAACINMLVALAGWILSRHHDVSPQTPASPAQSGSPKLVPPKTISMKHQLLLFGVCASGVISIGYELVWMRSICIPLGGFTYVFSAVLTIYLLGNVVGALIGSRLSRYLKQPAVGFGISLSCLGMIGIFYIPWLSVWIDTVHSGILLNNSILNIHNIHGSQGISLPLVYSTFLFLVPSIAMGIGFPLALQAWSRIRHKVGESTGIVYGINTIGAVLGGIVTGFLLIPITGTQLSITILGLLGIWLGLLLVLMFSGKANSSLSFGYTGIAVVLTIVALMIPRDLFRQKIVSSPDSETLEVIEGVTTTVAVKKSSNNNLLMTSNGVFIAGDDVHRIAQKMLGHLGMFLNGNADEVLSIGFGSGETVTCIAQHNINVIDCVEIAPEVVHLGLKYFNHINLGEQLHQKVTMKYMDAKNYLHLTDRKYDVIINDADIPAHSGSAPIFAKEHFQNSLKHLNPGGCVISKLHIANISTSGFNSILGTFLEVFPHVTIWFPTTNPLSFFYLVGSNLQQIISLQHIDDTLQVENVRNSVDYLNIHTSVDFLSCYIGDKNDIRRYLRDFNINGDYTPFVEFNLEQTWQGMQEELFLEFMGKVRNRSIVNHIDWTGISGIDQKQWLENYESAYNVSTCLYKILWEKDYILRFENILDGLNLAPDHAILNNKKNDFLETVNIILADVSRSATSEADPETLENYRVLVRGIDILLQKRPHSGLVWLIKSWILKQSRNIDEALIAGEKAIEYDPDNADTHYNVANILARYLRKFDEAVPYCNEALRLKPDSAASHILLGNVYALQVEPLRKSGVLSEARKKIKEALHHYNEAVRINPKSNEAVTNSAKFKALLNRIDDEKR